MTLLKKLFNQRNVQILAIFSLFSLAIFNPAMAATNTGTVLQPTFDLLNEMSGGYGKQIIILVGFIAALISLVSLRGFSPILGYIGMAIFAGVGLAMGTGIAGALI